MLIKSSLGRYCASQAPAGKDPLDKNKLDALERPRGIDRKTFGKLD
jgi:hypothetical protein